MIYDSNECTLTRRQRHKVYKALLKEVIKDPSTDDGMCWYLNYLLDEDSSMPPFWRLLGSQDKMECLEELLIHRTGFLNFWAPRNAAGWRTRIKWIVKAIEQTKGGESPKRSGKKASGIKNTPPSKTRVKRKR